MQTYDKPEVNYGRWGGKAPENRKNASGQAKKLHFAQDDPQQLGLIGHLWHAPRALAFDFKRAEKALNPLDV